MRKIIILSAIFFVFQLVLQLHGSSEQISIVRSGGFQNDIRPHSSKIQMTKSKIPKNLNYSTGIIDTLTWRNENASRVVNFTFARYGESLLVWLEPVAACSLLAIRFRPMNWEGNMLLDIWDAMNYDPLIYSMDSTDENGWWGTYEPEADPSGWVPGDIVGHTPLGWDKNDPYHHYWGSYPFTVTKEHAGTWIEISTGSGPQGVIDVGRDPFYIGAAFYMTDGWGFFVQEPYPGSTPYSFFKFYQPAGPGPRDGWFLRSYFPWFEAIVSYYENTPPEFENLKVQSYTYFSGPYPITVDIEDYDAEDGMKAGVTSAELIFSINSVENTVFMNGPSHGGRYAGEIPELAVGDIVTYWIRATDFHGLSSRTDKFTFGRVKPQHPSADILLIWDNWKDENLDSCFNDLFAGLETHYEFELWNITQGNGIDASVINWDWKTIYISGQESRNTIPGRSYDNTLFVEWLEAGTTDKPHTLLYVDQDYFCAHSEYECDWETQMGPGDFLFDYCGIKLAVSDHHGSYSTGYDTAAVGIGDHEGTLVIFKGGSSRPDWIAETTDDAEQIFYYKDHPEYGAGIRLDRGHYKTCFLPWSDVLAFETRYNGNKVPREGLVRTVETVLEWFGTETVRDDRCQGLVGDPTGDGFVNVLDVLTVVNHIVGKDFLEEDGLCRGDCTGDNHIDVLDVVGIVRVIMGLGECEL